MTTYDPDTLQQDRSVLKRIVDEFDGTMALDCVVVVEGLVREGDPVTLLGHGERNHAYPTPVGVHKERQ